VSYLFLGLIGITAVVYSLSRQPHQFSSGECNLCHFNENKKPMNIKTDITSACYFCHQDQRGILTHPTDIYPTLSIPKDMPLVDGRFTCITCHYVHPKGIGQDKREASFLRRQVSGVLFCSACHKIDEKRHIMLENAHTGTYLITDHSNSIDRMSLECIECHTAYTDASGIGTWTHSSGNSHPVGVSYEDASSKKTHKFRPVSMLSRDIRLFDGKIGCGTCHNIYSKEKFMLTMNNFKSRLCLECHIK